MSCTGLGGAVPVALPSLPQIFGVSYMEYMEHMEYTQRAKTISREPCPPDLLVEAPLFIP